MHHQTGHAWWWCQRLLGCHRCHWSVWWSPSRILKMHFAYCRDEFVFASFEKGGCSFWGWGRVHAQNGGWCFCSTVHRAKVYSKGTGIHEFTRVLFKYFFSTLEYEAEKECETHYKYRSLSFCRIIKEIRVCYKLLAFKPEVFFYFAIRMLNKAYSNEAEVHMPYCGKEDCTILSLSHDTLLS